MSTEKSDVDDMASTNSNAKKIEVESVTKSSLSNVEMNSDEEVTRSASKAETMDSPKTEAREQQQQQQQKQQQQHSQATSSKFSLVTDYSSSSNDSD